MCKTRTDTVVVKETKGNYSTLINVINIMVVIEKEILTYIKVAIETKGKYFLSFNKRKSSPYRNEINDFT